MGGALLRDNMSIVLQTEVLFLYMDSILYSTVLDPGLSYLM